MAYANFYHPRACDRSIISPVFYIDGSPVYEDLGERGLLSTILQRNDVGALKLYNGCAHTRVFLTSYGWDDSNPFYEAIHYDSFDVLRELFSIYRSSPSLTEPVEDYLKRFHISPVIEACATGNQEMVSWLMDYDPPLGNLHDHDFDGQTALFRAAKALRKAGNLALEAKHEDIPAAQQQCKRIESFIMWLLDNECSLDVYDELFDEEEESESDNVPKLSETVLGNAVSYASYELVSRLVAMGADVHRHQDWCGGFLFKIEYASDVTALHTAALSWNNEAIRALTDHHGDIEAMDMVATPDSYGRLPLHWALAGVDGTSADDVDSDDISSRMNGTIKLLLDINSDTVYARDRHSATIFHHAARNNTGWGANIEAFRLLLHANQRLGTINIRNDAGATALGELIEHHDCLTGGLIPVSEILGMLIESGADLRACDHLGRNALQRLCSVRWQEPLIPSIIDPLLNHLNINETDDLGCTALHYLVRNIDQVDAVRYLVSRGADVNIVDSKGNSPLHEVMKGRIILRDIDFTNSYDRTERSKQLQVQKRDLIIQILLGAGASKEVVNNAGKTPKQILGFVKEQSAAMDDMHAGRGRGRGGAIGRG